MYIHEHTVIKLLCFQKSKARKGFRFVEQNTIEKIKEEEIK